MSLSICRTCLSGTSKVYTIRNTPFQEIYRKLTNNELITNDGRPDTVCYLCYAQMQRWMRIKTKSGVCEEIWTQLLQNNIHISQESITILSQRIEEAYITTPIELYSCLKVDIYHRPLINNIDIHTTVKIEPTEIDINSEEPKGIKIEAKVVHNPANAICRSCLGAVIKTHSIESTALQSIYEKLTCSKLVTGDGRPLTVCHICRWLLIKCHKFIIKANKCDKILIELFRNGIQLTDDAIAVLGKRMKTDLVVTPIKLFTYVEVTDVKVKQEVIERDGDNYVKQGTERLPVILLTRLNMAKHLHMQATQCGVDDSPVSRKITLNEHPKKSFVKMRHCNECSYGCNTETKLNKHKRFHDPERKFSCIKCHFRFNTNNNLRSHQKLVHALKYKCDKCPKKFPNIRKFKMHKLTHTNNYLTCEVCAKVFANRPSLRLHTNINHPNAKYPCDKCNVVFATSQYLREHELKIHTRHSIYICDLCGNKYKEKGLIRKHMKFVHMEREKLECDECGKKVPNKTTMIAHLGSHRLIKRYKCKLCLRLFNTSSSLSIHKRNHQKFSCKVCGSFFKFNLDLLAHVKIHPELACNICHEFAIDIEKHKKMHKGVIVKCHICDKKMRKNNIYSHLRAHTGVKPHGCDVCHKRFFRKHAFKSHMAIHTGKKNFSCDICDKHFIQISQLKCHLQAHAGSKPFDCMHCEKKFSEKRALQYHINTEHTKKTTIFICDMCHQVHTNKEQLIKHIKSHKGKKYHNACPICKKAFRNLSLMCHHTETHTNVKWPCTMCDQKLVKVNINRHYFVNHGVPAYACTICEEGTNTVSMLISHMRSHDVASYRCQTCGKKFTEGSKLLRHMRKVHDITPKRPYYQYYSMMRY